MKVKFFTQPNGRSPLISYLQACDKRQYAKIMTQINQLKTHGITPANPSVKKLTNTPFWELRILGKHNIRIICCVVIKDTVHLLHIFVKKSQQIKSKDLKTAFNRYKVLLDQYT